MTTTPVADAVSQLASDLEGLTIRARNPSSKMKTKNGDMSALVPTLQQFYQTGRLLFQVNSTVNNDNSNSNDVLMAYQHLIDSIPDTLLQGSFHQLQQATSTLIQKSNSASTDTTLIPAAQSLAGLFTHSPRLCQVNYSNEWVSVLSSMYDKLVLAKQSEKNKGIVLSCLSALFLDGLFLKKSSSNNGKSTEESLLEAVAAMEEESTDCLRDLQLWQSQHEPFRRTLESSLQNWAESGGDNNNDDDERIQQREYILNMLESARQQRSSTETASMGTQDATKSSNTSNNGSTKTKTSPADELDRRIQQVKQILPHLGEGFIEAALSLYQADVETTVATLLNDPSQYPSALKFLDPNLPRRKKEHNLQDDAADAEQARQIVKERVALEEEREAQRYQALMYVTSQQKDAEEKEQATVHHNYKDEYNDDYDDQYDEVDIRLGGADDGFTMDVGFEQVKLYNQLVRHDEAEDSFWEDNRNTNRNPNRRSKSPKGNDGGGGGGKQYRGPDKIKGGRVIGTDGKLVKKPGGARKRNNNKKDPPRAQAQGGGKNNNVNSNNNNNGQANGNQSQPNANNKKPKTKPKSDNRVNRRRDQKQRKQGNFGVQD